RESKETVVSDYQPAEPLIEDHMTNLHSNDTSKANQVSEIIPVQVTEPILPEPITTQSVLEGQPKSQFRNRERLFLYCLPVEQVSSTDDLYGEKTVKSIYKEPFKFQASVIDGSDLRMIYWTTVSQVAEG